jgi:putative selenium metabolism hydrolase
MTNELAKKVFALAEKYRDDAIELLSDIIAIPAESNQEGPRLEYLKRRIEALDAADRTFFDPFGNLCWVVGNGPKTIWFDGHTDCVGTGPLEDWDEIGLHPHEAVLKGNHLFGRGSADQLGGVINQVFATKIIKELGLGTEYTVYSIGSVAEEDNDGGGPRWLFREGVPSGLYPMPDAVVLTEGTSHAEDGALGIYRGHRGRMEIVVETFGRSCHGSNPDIGDNAIVKMAPIIQDVNRLQTDKLLKDDDFIGRGSVTISRISDNSPSNCCVAPYCKMILDRRLTFGETKESAIAEIRNLPSVKVLGDKVKVDTLHYTEPTWTGHPVDDDICFLAWATPEDDPVVTSAVETYRQVITPNAGREEYATCFRAEPRVGCWIFSSDGVGVPNDIPTIGFSSGAEQNAHIVGEFVDVRELVGTIAFLALFPTIWSSRV